MGVGMHRVMICLSRSCLSREGILVLRRFEFVHRGVGCRIGSWRCVGSFHDLCIPFSILLINFVFGQCHSFSTVYTGCMWPTKVSNNSIDGLRVSLRRAGSRTFTKVDVDNVDIDNERSAVHVNANRQLLLTYKRRVFHNTGSAIC